MLALAVVVVRLTQTLAVRALDALERGLVMDVEGGSGRCGECGNHSFTIANFDNPDMEGTVKIDGAGNVVLVEGLLFCAHCGELFDPDAGRETQRQGHLRLVIDN